jgi:hypothetical protein
MQQVRLDFEHVLRESIIVEQLGNRCCENELNFIADSHPEFCSPFLSITKFACN